MAQTKVFISLLVKASNSGYSPSPGSLNCPYPSEKAVSSSFSTTTILWHTTCYIASGPYKNECPLSWIPSNGHCSQSVLWCSLWPLLSNRCMCHSVKSAGLYAAAMLDIVFNLIVSVLCDLTCMCGFFFIEPREAVWLYAVCAGEYN
jgi:hypothetical protein